MIISLTLLNPSVALCLVGSGWREYWSGRGLSDRVLLRLLGSAFFFEVPGGRLLVVFAALVLISHQSLQPATGMAARWDSCTIIALAEAPWGGRVATFASDAWRIDESPALLARLGIERNR